MEEELSSGTRRSVVLKNADGVIKKPNASQGLGSIMSVSAADSQKKMVCIILSIVYLSLLNHSNVYLHMIIYQRTSFVQLKYTRQSTI